VSSSNGSDIDRYKFCTANTLDLFMLKDSQESDLGRHREFSNLIEKNRAIMGALEAAPLSGRSNFS
jgi:hypothetical protein